MVEAEVIEEAPDPQDLLREIPLGPLNMARTKPLQRSILLFLLKRRHPQ